MCLSVRFEIDVLFWWDNHAMNAIADFGFPGFLVFWLGYDPFLEGLEHIRILYRVIELG